ncbi:hypothetical protein IMSAGC013_00948 [Lachnospiraceae bacterium]|nr:hypothetical protein IMSAGC013_00948 [Lachnospiraceae bacterium]
MKIVKNFYDMAEERRKKEERRYQNTRKTPEEEQREQREAETLIRAVETFEQNTCFVPDKEKEAEFEQLSLGVLEAAELLNINVTIDTDKREYAVIEFSMKQLFIVDCVSPEIRSVIGMLFMKAEEIWIDREENHICITFYFSINNRIVKKEQK